jgi:flagellar biosynthesis regulator FlaF
MNCPFAAHGRQEACLSLQKQRDALMTREYDRNECYSCPMRRKRLEGAKEPERIAVPPAQFNKTVTIQPKKEAMVDQAKVKENVLRVLERKGRMTISNLKLFAAAKESKEDFRTAVDALAGEGKIVTEQGSREGSLSVALPGAEKKVATSNDATVPSKSPRRVNRKPATPPIKTRAKAEATVSAPRKAALISAAIALLEEKRTAALDTVEKIDAALAGLRALA